MPKLYYPKKIIDSKFDKNKVFYLVEWKRSNVITWEPEEYIWHREDLIEEYYDMRAIENVSLQTGGYIYIRVSSKQQSNYSEGCTSLEVQEQECRKYCEANDINVIKCVREVFSARKMDKMKGLHYLCSIASKGQKIYVYDISRFSRNTVEALNLLDTLEKKGVSIHSVTENLTYDSYTSRHQFRLQLCAAHYVSDICSEKVRASIAFRRARGDWIGSTAFGYKTVVDEKTRIRSKVPNEDEMKIISKIKDNESNTLENIVKILIDDNITFRGNNPTEKNVSRIIYRFKTDLKCFNKSLKVVKNKSSRTRIQKPY